MFSAVVRQADFDPSAEAESLVGRGVGALVAFTGYCRDEDGTLSGLELEHYPGMAEAEFERLLTRARTRWSLLGARIIHRYGVIEAGERIVFVAVAAAHRGEAFAAAEFLMDFLKTQAPFWKRERRADGSFGAWVAAKQADDDAIDKWSKG